MGKYIYKIKDVLVLAKDFPDSDEECFHFLQDYIQHGRHRSQNDFKCSRNEASLFYIEFLK